MTGERSDQDTGTDGGDPEDTGKAASTSPGERPWEESAPSTPWSRTSAPSTGRKTYLSCLSPQPVVLGPAARGDEYAAPQTPLGGVHPLVGDSGL